MKGAKVGFFIRIVAKKFFFKTIWKKKLKKGALILVSKFKKKYSDLTFFKFCYNLTLILKKRLTPLGGIVFGPSFYSLRRKKIHLSFKKLL